MHVNAKFCLIPALTSHLLVLIEFKYIRSFLSTSTFFQTPKLRSAIKESVKLNSMTKYRLHVQKTRDLLHPTNVAVRPHLGWAGFLAIWPVCSSLISIMTASPPELLGALFTLPQFEFHATNLSVSWEWDWGKGWLEEASSGFPEQETMAVTVVFSTASVSWEVFGRRSGRPGCAAGEEEQKSC